MLVMSFGVASGVKRYTVKALVVAESAEWTPVRYALSIRSGEWEGEFGRRANGLWRSNRLEGWWMKSQSLSISPRLPIVG